MKLLWTTLILILVWLSACSRHAQSTSFVAAHVEFGSTIADKDLNLKSLRPIKYPKYNIEDVVSVSSKDWFTLADLLLQNERGSTSLKNLGQSLVDTFYRIPNSSTNITASMSPPGSPYGEAAVWFAKPILTRKMKELYESASIKVSNAAYQIKVDLSDLPMPYPPPENVLKRIISALNDFKVKLIEQKNGTADSVVDSIVASLNSKYIADLEELRRSVTWASDVPLSTNMQGLKDNLAHMTEISEFQRRHLLFQVGLCVELTKKSSAASDPESFLGFLGEFWLAKDIRKNFPERVAALLTGLTDRQLFSLATLNRPEVVPAQDWPALKSEKDTIPLPDRSLIALYLENNGALLSEEEWSQLQEKKIELDKILDDPEYSDFARVVANVPSELKDEQRFALISAWLAIPERLAVPTALKDIFRYLSEEEIKLLTEKSSFEINSDISFIDSGLKTLTAKSSLSLLARGHVDLAKYRYGIIDALGKPGGLDEIKSRFENGVSTATRERLDLALVPIANRLPDQIKESLLPQLKLSTDKNSDNILPMVQRYGRYYLGKLVFGVPNLKKNDADPNLQENAQENALIQRLTLPLFESSKMIYTFKNHSWSEAETPFSTNSELLGRSLALLPSRISLSPDQVALEYQMISKLMAIAGYHDSDGNLVESLTVAMDHLHSDSLFDVANYDPKKIVFATPDILKIKSNFKLDPSSRAAPTVSVAGQMELLRGYSSLMRYLKPWTESLFDKGLGALRIDEEANLSPFNKGDFFLLSTALGADILMNIQYKMLGLITKEFNFVDGTKIAEPGKISAVGAVLTNYTRSGSSRRVETADIAKAILAMSEFFEVTADLTRSTNPHIVENVEGNKLSEKRNLLQKLIAGMVLFSSSHLMLDDGGYVSGFDLEKMLPDSRSQRTLSDQLLMEEALLRASQVFQSGLMASRALDNFFFLNREFWSESLGFYRSVEKGEGQKVSLINVARALKNVQEMISLDVTQGSKIQSVRQMELLVQLWSDRFFNKDVLSLEPVYLLSDFSL